jgi:hypothetical protein
MVDEEKVVKMVDVKVAMKVLLMVATKVDN